MPDSFTLLVGGQLQTFTSFAELPAVYQAVIAFQPDFASQIVHPGEDGFTVQQVAAIIAERDQWVSRLQDMIVNETGLVP